MCSSSAVAREVEFLATICRWWKNSAVSNNWKIVWSTKQGAQMRQEEKRWIIWTRNVNHGYFMTWPPGRLSTRAGKVVVRNNNEACTCHNTNTHCIGVWENPSARSILTPFLFIRRWPLLNLSFGSVSLKTQQWTINRRKHGGLVMLYFVK